MAITLVFLFHYTKFGHPLWLEAFGRFGWTGVDLFFVLSGFLIASQLFRTVLKKEAVSVPLFFTKRFFRIIPAYLVVLGLYACFPFLREHEGLSPLWKYLTFTLNFGLDLRKTGTFTHAWSLCIEEQFYLVFPILILVLVSLKAGKATGYVLLSLFITGLILRSWSWYQFIRPASNGDTAAWYEFIYYPTYNRMDGVLAGVTIAAIFAFSSGAKTFHRYANLFLVTGILVLFILYFLLKNTRSYNTSVYGFPLLSTAFGLIVTAAVLPGCRLLQKRSRITSFIASLSYSLYLVHKMAIHLTQHFIENYGLDVNSNLTVVLSIITSMGFAVTLRTVIEKPALVLRDRVIKMFAEVHYSK